MLTIRTRLPAGFKEGFMKRIAAFLVLTLVTWGVAGPSKTSTTLVTRIKSGGAAVYKTDVVVSPVALVGRTAACSCNGIPTGVERV